MFFTSLLNILISAPPANLIFLASQNICLPLPSIVVLHHVRVSTSHHHLHHPGISAAHYSHNTFISPVIASVFLQRGGNPYTTFTKFYFHYLESLLSLSLPSQLSATTVPIFSSLRLFRPCCLKYLPQSSPNSVSASTLV